MRNTSLLRRAAALGCAALLTFGLAACGEKEEPQTETRLYRDGTYTAQFDTAGADGYTTYAVVEIAGDKVSVTEFDGKNASGALRSADTELADSMKAGASEYLTFEPTPANLSKKAMEDFAAAGGDPDSMALTAGGPEYGLELAALVDAVLDGPAKADSESGSTQVEVPYYADGSYKVTVQDFDLSGYKEYIVLKVSGGVPTVEEFDAVDEEGKLRSEDTEINPKVPYSESVPALMDSFNSARTVEGIETVTGATESSDCFRLLVERALENAHLRYSTDDTVDVLGDGSGLKDGVYKAEMSEFENGWKDYVIAQVWHGNVVIVELDSLNESGTKKSADSSFARSLKDNDKAPGDSVAVYLGKIVSAFNRADGDLPAMENVAGATISANNFKIMLGELMGGNMVTGDTEVREIAPLTAEELSGEASSEAEDSSSSESSSSAA